MSVPKGATMTTISAGALVALEELARMVRPDGSVNVRYGRSRWEITVFRTLVDHSHYEGESIIEAVQHAHTGECSRPRGKKT